MLRRVTIRLGLRLYGLHIVLQALSVVTGRRIEAATAFVLPQVCAGREIMRENNPFAGLDTPPHVPANTITHRPRHCPISKAARGAPEGVDKSTFSANAVPAATAATTTPAVAAAPRNLQHHHHHHHLLAPALPLPSSPPPGAPPSMTTATLRPSNG